MSAISTTVAKYSSGAYREKLTQAPDVCRNCLSLIKDEFVDPYKSDQTRLQSTYMPRLDATVRGYHETHSVPPTCAKETYCTCGVSRPAERYWDAEDIDRARFEELLKNAIETAELKGISFSRKTTAKLALQRYKDTGEVDSAIALGLDAGMHVETVRGSDD